MQLLPNPRSPAASPPAPSPSVPIVPKIETIETLMSKALHDFLCGSGANEMRVTAAETVEVIEKGPADAWSKVRQT